MLDIRYYTESRYTSRYSKIPKITVITDMLKIMLYPYFQLLNIYTYFQFNFSNHRPIRQLGTYQKKYYTQSQNEIGSLRN